MKALMNAHRTFCLVLPLTVLTILLFVLSAQAATVYVDASNTSGNENGSEEHPYNTIQEAIDAASNVDTVKVKKGVYHENLVI